MKSSCTVIALDSSCKKPFKNVSFRTAPTYCTLQTHIIVM